MTCCSFLGGFMALTTIRPIISRMPADSRLSIRTFFFWAAFLLAGPLPDWRALLPATLPLADELLLPAPDFLNAALLDEDFLAGFSAISGSRSLGRVSSFCATAASFSPLNGESPSS